jgi:hypothetical protein
VTGKLALVGAVALAWLLTFVVLGGDMPGRSGKHADPVAGPSHAATSSPNETATSVPASPNATPNGSPTPSASSTPRTGPGSEAASAEAAARAAPLAGVTLEPRPKPRRTAPPVAEFTMATFNVLGSSHTRNGKHGAQKARGPVRMARATNYVIDNDIDLVGFQEMQPDQRATFLKNAGDRYGLYPGGRTFDGDNSIAWRLDTWDLVKPGSVPIPYFGGHPRNMPVLLLRNKATGITIYASNFHNPADTREFGKQGKWRVAATAREVHLFTSLRNGDYPVFVTGDMNETQPWFCAVAGPGDLKAAAGGEGGRNGCSVAAGYRIDWIAGSHDVEFTRYVEDRSRDVHTMTDHPVMIADVRIDSRNFPKSVTLAPPAGTPADRR